MKAEKKQKYQSRFSSCVKVRPETRNWLEENKDTKTIAGFLDKIINNYKRHHEESSRLATSDTGDAEEQT
jgi:hypothetical protein